MKKLTLFLFTFIFFGSPTVFGEDTNIRVLETKKLERLMLINRMCIGGYEFVVICKGDKNDQCSYKGNHSSISQIITEDGGGKKC